MFKKKLSLLFFLSLFFVQINAEEEKKEAIKTDSLLGRPAFIKQDGVFKISLGSSLPLTGGISTIGKDYSNGLNMVFNAFNRRVAEHKKNISLFSLDDHYSILKGSDNIKTLQKKMPLLVGILQDKTLELFQNDLETGRLGAWLCMSGSKKLRESNLPLSVQFRPSLEREVEALVSYVIKQKQLDSIMVFYEASDWGKAGLAAVKKYVAEANRELKDSCSYPINTVHIHEAMQAVIKGQPSAVICIAHARPTYNLIQSVLSEGLQHCQFFGTSEVAPIQYLLKKSRGIDIGMSMVVPDPFKSQLPIVQSYKEEMQKNFPYVELSPFSLEGFIAGKVITFAIEKAVENATLAGLMQEFSKIKKARFGGMALDYSAENHTLSRAIWIKESFDKEAVLFLE